MKRVVLGFVMVIFLVLVLFFAALMVSARRIKDSQKRRPFECGFDPLGSGRFPFSLQFFLVAILFLLFDVEIALIYPLASRSVGSFRESAFVSSLRFLGVVFGGLIHE